MKRTVYILSSFSAMAILFLILFYSESETNVACEPVGDLPKGEPAEEFFNQRAYPDKEFDFIAYEKALNQVKLMMFQKDNDEFPGFDRDWIVQGPGNIGARVNSVAVHPTNENIIYCGFSDGGVFKSIDGGQNWNPIFDDQVFLVTGDVVLDPTNPETVFVGTGDPNISGYPSIGDGLYKSTDGGGTWTHLGLTDQRIISKVLIHPENSDTLFVATMGIPFVKNNDRGLYKSDDGGQTWNQTLFVNDSTGIIDVVMDPFNPSILYAASWNRIRNNQQSIARGPDSKVFKTTDGGASWTEMSNGLPTGENSRVGLAISQTNGDKVYALYVGSNYEIEGVYKTVDAGNSWTAFNVVDLQNLQALGGFGWYFGKIRLNPANDDEVYVLGIDLHRTTNEGQSWEMVTPIWWSYEVHADKHDLTFGSNGSMFLATDGGLYSSSDQGSTWNDIENIATTQFYRVGFNPHQPGTYYGGAQDNGTTGGNVVNFNSWPRIFGGDGFQPRFHPINPNISFVETQRGTIWASDDNGYSHFAITSNLGPGEQKHWDMQYILSSFDPNVIYAGAEKLYRMDDIYSEIWTPVSPDLVGEGGFRSSISCLSESSLNQVILYVGTSNGKVWRSLNAGGNWDDIKPGLPDRYVSSVKASPTFQDRVYVTHSGYKDNDFFPHVHFSDDNGDSWTPIVGGLPEISVNDIIIIPHHEDSVIFIATDGGVYGSTSGGENWERLGANMPIIPVFDLEYNPQDEQLIAATFARGIQTYPIDSILDPGIIINVNDVNLANYEGVKIYPNPASNYIVLEYENDHPGFSSHISIYNSTGSLMFEIEEVDDLFVERRVDVSRFPAGAYFVRVKSKNLYLRGSFQIL